ncbi:uncharacterized protein LOC117422397 isoform X2 [Acipenser ruthenus]|uniref:uncharacterized protein LOC117422397 isoform X2 n=1 Tax=Acipenser ruthenus TaxID=7906 RepID=UPI00274082EE|nr:uncharacterized protein LOC117422397 isoform X2 [Acipenser ruthenus]
MANVKVAVRVRPLSKRESAEGGRIAVQVDEKVVRITNIKLDGKLDGPGDSREKLMGFGFDYCYWSVDPNDPNYSSQEEVFQDLGTSVLSGAVKGYNVCLFAYGQTGSGKTYTMMGTPVSLGLTPRICEALFSRVDDYPEGQNSCRVEVSFLEIYNERVRDLLQRPDKKKPFTLRVREHPEKGPYVQGLSQHVVSDYKQVVDLLDEGIANRITAATHVHDASSRSHAIFTIQYTQAILENNLPSEIVSKINLVDLAGSERADPNYCRDRITEGANINKSLVTLGIVISTLAQNCQMFSSCQSISSMGSEGEGSSAGSQSSSQSGSGRRHCYIPYRDSALTWLLKESLGGNSHTVMVATISPSSSSYNDTLSTLRYASHARSIVNKPQVNEDASVKLIRELREEIDRLKTMLMSFELRNSSPSLSEDRDGNLAEIVLQNELTVEQLTKDWSDKWKDKQELMEEYRVDINREKAGVLIDSHLPHLIAVDGDVLSTGIVFYNLREGTTRIGRSDGQDESDIILQGPGVERVCCEIVNERGVVTLRPGQGGLSSVNGREITEPCRLAQGAVIVLGRTHTFRFNHPAEAAVLRQRRRVTPLLPPACPVPGRKSSEGLLLSSGFCGWLDLEGESSPSPRYNLSPSLSARQEPRGVPEEEKQLGETGGLSEGSWERAEAHAGAEPPETRPSWRLVEQQRYVEGLREQILAAQLRAEQELEREQARINQQLRDNQQWLLQEKQRLASLAQKERRDLAVQTDPASSSESGVQVLMEAAGCGPSLEDRKRLVQQELLRSHALRRAERRIRRKRVCFQLERIGRKQQLLEAKRELQQLEDRDRDSLREQQIPAWARGRRRGSSPSPSRRHSFSADLLSRLYPQHIPIYSHFLKQKKSPEASAWSSHWCTRIPRKCLSEECLPAAGVRKRTRVSIGDCRHSRHKTGSVENLKGPDFHTWPNKDQPRICTTTAAITHRIHESQQPSSSASDHSKNKDRTASKSRRSKPLGKSSSEPKGSAKSNRCLKRIKMLISQSVSPGIKTVLAGMFRKPPSGQAGRATKSSNKAATRLSCSLERSAVKERPIKMASSFEDLDQLGKSTAGCSQERRWHSAEVLSDGIKQTAGRLLDGWEEDREDCESSDSDNLSSLDSLSSAYTKALTEQLMQEETAEPELSDGARDDSQMSQDSLAGTGSGKKLIHSPKVAAQSLQGLRLFHNPSSPGNWLDKWGRSVSLDSLANGEEEEMEDHSPQGSGASDEIPAEIYWKLQSPRTQDVHSTVLHKQHMGSEEKRKEMGTLASPPVMDDSPHLGDPFSSVQTHSRERAVSLSLTEAWSSCESSESPRMLKDSLNKSQGLYTKQTLFKTPSKVDGSKQLADNPDLSATGKGLESLRSETNSYISNLNQQLSQGEKNYWILNGTCVENKAHHGQPIAAISAAKSSTLGSDAGRTESCLAVTLSCSLRSEAEVESQAPISHGIRSPGSTVFNHLDGRKQDINSPSPTSRSKSLPVTFVPDLVEHPQTTPDNHPAISGSKVTDSENSNHFLLGYPEESLSVVEGTHIHAEQNKSVSSGEVCINEQEEGIIRDSNLSSASVTAAQIQELTELMLVPVNTQHSLDKGVKKDGVDTSPSFSEQETKSGRAIGDLKHSVKAEATCISGSTCPSAGPNLQVLSVQFRKDRGYTSSEALSEDHPTMRSMLIPNKESSAGTLLNKNRNHSLQAAVFETSPADPAMVPDLGITNEKKEFSLAGGDTEELILNPSAENENNGFPNLEPNCGTTMQTDFLQEQQIARPNTGQPTEEFSSTSIRAEVSDMTNTPERTTWEEKGLKSVQVNSSIEENRDLKQQTDRESATTVKDVDTPKTKDGDLICQTLLEGAEVEENQGKSSMNKSSLLSRHEFRLPGGVGVGVGQRKDSVATELQNDIKLLMDRTQLECSSVQVSDQRTTVRSTNPRLDADPEPLQKEKERGIEIGEGSLGTGMTDEGFNEGSSDNVSVEVCKLSGETIQVDPSVLKDTIKKQIQPSEFRKDICAVKIKNVHLTAPTCKSHVSDLAIKESREEEKSGDETELGQAGERINIAEGVRLEDTENVRPRGGVERNQQAVRREGKEGKKADSWSMVQRISTGESAQCSSAVRENDVPDCGNNEDRESEVQKVANEANIHRDSGVFDVEERHSTIREGGKAAVIPNQTENEVADALGNSKVRKHHHSARYSPIPSGESKLDHTGLLHTNQEDRKAADVHEINERNPKQHADVEAGTLNSTDTNQAVLQFMHKGNMSPQRDSRPTLATRTDKPHHVTRSDIPKGLQGWPIEVCTEGTNGLLKIKVEGTQSSIGEGHCGKCVSESMMKSRTPGGSFNGQACNDSAEASHLVLDVSSTTGAKERYTFSILKATNSATPRDKNAESRTSTERDGAEEDSSASLIAADDVPLTSGHMENHDVGLMSSTNWLENTGGDSLEFPETHSKGNTTEELLISKHLTEKPARPGSNTLIGSPQLPPPNFSAASEGLCFLLNPEQLHTCKPAVLKDSYVRIDMANFCLDSKKQSRFPLCSQNHERVRETGGNKEGYFAQTKAQKIYPGTSQCNTRESSMERLKYAQIGDTGHSAVYEEESEEIEAVVPGEVEGSAIQISDNMTSGMIGTKQCHYSTHIPRIAEDGADLVAGTNDSHERAGASDKTSLKMERTKMIMYDHLCSKNTEAASTDTEHISLDSECNKPLSTEERSMATQDAGAKGFPQWSKNQHGNKRSSLEGSLYPSSHAVGSEAFNYRDRRNQEDVTEPEPEENYLENISRPSKEEYSPPERGLKESVKMKATSQQDSQTTTPGVYKIQMDPGAQDYFDIRMSNWTVQHGQPVQYVPERSTHFNKMNQIQSSVLQTSHFSVHEVRSDTEMGRGIESSDQSLAFGTPSEKDPPVSLNREGAFAIQTVSDVVLTHRPLEAGSDKAYQQRHEQLEQLHETAALLKDSTDVALSGSETDQNKAPESLISLAGRLKKGSKTSLAVSAAIAEEGDNENTASSHSGVQSTALKGGVCKCEGQKEGKEELASRDKVLIVNPKECQEYTTVYITPQTPNNNHNDQPNAAFLKSTPLNVAVHDRPASKAAQPENNPLKSTTHLRGTPLYFTEKPSLSLLECLQGQDKHIVQRTCSEEQHNPTLTDKSAGSKHEEGPVNISTALNSSEGIGKKQISCGTPGVESREQGVLNLSSSKEQRQTDLPAAVLTEIAVTQDYRRGNVSIASTSAVGFIKLLMAEENSAKDVEAASVDIQVIQRSAGIEFNSNHVPVFSTTLSPQALGEMHVQQKITEKQATQRHRELEADGNITVPYTHIQYPTLCGATVGSHGVATTSAPSSVHRSNSLEDLECTVSDPAKEDSSSTDDRGAFWDNGDRANVDKNQKKKQKLRRGKQQPPSSESYNSSSSTSQDTTHSSSQEQSGEHLRRSPDRPSASSPRYRGNRHSEHSRLENSNEEHRAYSQKHRLSALLMAGLPSDAEHGVESTANFHQGFRGMHAQSNGEFHLSKSPKPPDDDTHYLQPGALKDAKTNLKSPSPQGKLFKKNTKTSCNEDPECTSSGPLTTRLSGAQVMTHHSTEEGAQVPFLSHHRRHSRQSSRKERCHPQEGTSGMHDEKEMMHFGSSDINPYVHPWRQEETSRVGWKHHAFGSASDISCQPPLQDGSNQRVTRCSSVDNGLNVQNSPLHSHLSSYANARAISSTLSSVEDFQGQDSFDTEYNSHQHNHPRPRDALNLESRVSSYQIPPGAHGNSSVQVDEIMLLYPSEPKSTVKSLSEVTLTVTCDQGTQTSAEARQRKANRHRSSSTQVPVSRKEVEENVAQRPTSWASLQNMSIHLSQLLHNTSDLLGNLHSLGAGDPQLQPIGPFQSNTPDSLHNYIPSNGRRTMDSCAQTSVDVGIQTDHLYQAVRVIKQHLPVEDTKRPQEVNVIVKVVGSDILNISQENKDITLTLLERKKKATVKMQSMPDLRIGNASVLQTSLESHHSADASPVCVRASTPSLDQNSAPIILGLSSVGSPSSLPGQSISPSNLVRGCSISSPQLSRLENQVFQEGDTDRDCSLSSKAKAHSKQVQMVDRATSPILTLEAGISSPVARSKSTQCLTDGENPELQEDSLDGQRKYQSTFRYGIQEPRDSHRELTESENGLQRDNRFITTSRTTDRVVADVGKVSVVSEPRMRGRKSYPLKPVPSSMEDVHNSAGTKYFVDRSGRQIPVKMDWQSSSEEINLRKSSSVQHLPGSCSSTFSRLQDCATSAQIRSAHELLAISTQENTSTQTHEGSLTIRIPCKTNAAHYLTASDGCEGWIRSASCHNQSPDPYPFEPSEVSEMTVQLQEDNDDATSVAPSECNTEVLLNINPIVDDPQTSSHNHGKCRVPEDLPLHNKFSNWSGVHFRPPSLLSSAAVRTASGSQTQKMKRLSQGEPMENDSEFRACEGERMREIEKLRRERAEIMSGVRLEMNPHQLTVELTEAKLNYGLGETDTLLKLHSGTGKETDGVTIKQQLYDRHMKSIEGLRREREARLQSCRRARSLSPNKHPVLCAGTQGEPASWDPDLPSKRREYLQQLRQGVVKSTRVKEPKKWLAQTPSEIELLLRDYGRAREEARTEIARARDRLRERTEQEKRRLQQQALSQLVKEELRLRTRVSTSTLCTDSCLSLSSGPSSGYNSSNTTAPPGGSKATLQLGSEVTEESRAGARGRPALQRQCLSEHDVCSEASSNHHDVPAGSQQPAHSSGTRGKGPSISSASSASASYQEIAAHTVASATAEIQAASEGDLGNLLKGKAAASWRYQSTERGVLAYYKEFPSPTKHGFLCAGVIEQPLHSVWCLIRDHSKTHLYDRAIKTARVTSVESGVQLVYLVMDSSLCCLKQPRDFCCISAESKQEEQFVLALRSVYDEALPRPGRELVRGEVLPSAWVLQPDTRHRKEVTKVVYMTQVDLGTPALPQRLLGFVAKRQAMVIANLASFFPL